MAIYRRATMDQQTLSLYSSKLATECFEDVISAIGKIEVMPREAGETALPEIGTILAMVKVAGVARENRVRNAGRTVLSRWRCPECGVTMAGYITPDDYERRSCHGIPKRKHNTGEICGAAMEQVHREHV
jgi:hypothetical protein